MSGESNGPRTELERGPLEDVALPSPAQQRMVEGYLRHTACEFFTHDVDTAVATMAGEPHVILLPTLIGGIGREACRRFYRDSFIFSMPKDVEFVPISRIVGADTIVEESILRFTHREEVPWILPGVAPTGRRVEVAVCTFVRMQDDKIAHEHVYWDQASVLTQLGLIDDRTLPVVGAEAARQLESPMGPLNTLQQR
ncbi:MAG: nuclear transport factor 2 family protein [Deltaproteobacteria bacterium]|nr:nuclear transport factor 2 family protein [Deltaproteobacteria bacterium]